MVGHLSGLPFNLTTFCTPISSTTRKLWLALNCASVSGCCTPSRIFSNFAPKPYPLTPASNFSTTGPSSSTPTPNSATASNNSTDPSTDADKEEAWFLWWKDMCFGCLQWSRKERKMEYFPITTQRYWLLKGLPSASNLFWERKTVWLSTSDCSDTTLSTGWRYHKMGISLTAWTAANTTR